MRFWLEKAERVLGALWCQSDRCGKPV